MPGSFKKGNALNTVPAPIKSDLKSRRIIWEAERPIRWSFMKVLREYSTLKQFYPEVNPYTEVYQVRDNVWALYNDSFDGAGDVWMYLIEGSEKALLVDNSFGVGDLKGLIRKLIGDKEVIPVITHAHFDHCYGSAQFDKVYCHKNEVPDLMKKNNPDIWDYLFNQTDHDEEVWGETIHPGEPLYTRFDRKDIIVDLDHKENYKPYEIVGVENGHEFDLGNGYIVEAVLLPGHTPGMCGYWDHQTDAFFIGDTTGMGNKPAGEPYGEFCTVEAMHDELVKVLPRLKPTTRIFPGHGALDQSCILLKYLLETTERIMNDPEHPDHKNEFVRDGVRHVGCSRLIEQWSAMRYSPERIFKKQFFEAEK
ncbi:MAG: MBL fold metallo-hydrolase [Erysipelotrichaceae bacterium]|nr:MBL fold metallo-hydrolase [Erysipelotrichaceae bacterium]